MSKRELDLDRLTALLGQCLGRIDEQALRAQRQGDGDDGDVAGDAFEGEAVTLQELVASLLATEQEPPSADLERTVDRAVQSYVAEIGIPLVVRMRLGRDLPRVACGPQQLAHVVRRSLVLAADQLDVGGELIITTRREHDTVALEIESRGAAGERHPHHRARAETLCDFVASLGGTCRLALDEQLNLLLGIELPAAMAIGEC
jgi:signal transduction histidine kinase